MPAITCVTVAYNAEKTLKRTVESVLTQSCQDFVYMIVDHGSTDSTRRIIRDYEQQNIHVKGIYDDENRGAAEALRYIRDCADKLESRWFIILDADDEYNPEAFQTLLAYAEAQDADIVCCGSDFIDQKSGQICGRRAIPQCLLLDTPRAFSDYLPAYHMFMRTWWAKLIRADVLKRMDWSWIACDEISDTRFAFECLSHSQKVAVIPEVLHKYYLSAGSSFNNLVRSMEGAVDLRIRGDRRINAFIKQFLVERWGQVTPRNDDFLLIVYMNALWDLTIVISNAALPLDAKVAALHETFVCDDVRHLAQRAETLGAYAGMPENAQLCQERFSAVTDSLVPLVETKNLSITEQIIDILAVFGERYLRKLLGKSFLLQRVTAQSAGFLKTSIAHVLHGDLPAALDEIYRLAGMDIPDQWAESYFLLAEYLCAALEYADGWLMFRDLRAQFLQEQGYSTEEIALLIG